MFGEWLVGVPRSRGAWLLGFTLSGVWTSPLWALEYEYHAPDSCPNREAFLSEVRSRLRYPAERSTVERLQVTVRRQQGFEASFVLLEPGQPPVSRTLTAEACDEAVRALALGAALALDARYREVQGIPEDPPTTMEASAEPGVLPPPSPVPAAEPSPVPAAGVAASVQPPPGQPPPGQPPPAQPLPAQPLPARPPSAQPPPVTQAPRAVGVDVHPADARTELADPEAPSFATRLGAFGATGYAPDPSFGPSLAVVLRNDRFGLELEAFFGAENRAGNGEQSAEFWVLGGRLIPCARWPLPGRFWIKGCGVVELSGVHAEGVESSDVASTAEDLVPYWALGVVLGAEAPLTQALSLSLDLGAQFPLSERSFYFENGNADEELHEFPTVAARGQLAICYAF